MCYDVEDPPKTHVSHLAISLLRIPSASLWCRSLDVRGRQGRENRLCRKLELYVLYVSLSRTAATPQPHTVATHLPLCPQHLLLRNTMRRRCHWALELCRNTSSPEVSSFLCCYAVLVLVISLFEGEKKPSWWLKQMRNSSLFNMLLGCSGPHKIFRWKEISFQGSVRGKENISIIMFHGPGHKWITSTKESFGITFQNVFPFQSGQVLLTQ